VISKLSQRGLIRPDIHSSTSQIYAGLFGRYIQQQTPPPQRRNIDQVANELSAIDSKLYHYLVENPDRLLTFEELLTAVWGDSCASKKGLEAAIHRLRTRIKDVEGQDQDHIQNVRKKGFMYHPN
jgi:DNA-binding response OmpR family regulator